MDVRAHSRPWNDHAAGWRALFGCALLLSLVACRSALRVFPPLSEQTTVRANLQHCGQKQIVEHGDQASPPQATILPELVPQFSLVQLQSAPLLSLRTEGFHYNRPPPVS